MSAIPWWIIRRSFEEAADLEDRAQSACVASGAPMELVREVMAEAQAVGACTTEPGRYFIEHSLNALISGYTAVQVLVRLDSWRT